MIRQTDAVTRKRSFGRQFAASRKTESKQIRPKRSKFEPVATQS